MGLWVGPTVGVFVGLWVGSGAGPLVGSDVVGLRVGVPVVGLGVGLPVVGGGDGALVGVPVVVVESRMGSVVGPWVVDSGVAATTCGVVEVGPLVGSPVVMDAWVGSSPVVGAWIGAGTDDGSGAKST